MRILLGVGGGEQGVCEGALDKLSNPKAACRSLKNHYTPSSCYLTFFLLPFLYFSFITDQYCYFSFHPSCIAHVLFLS